MNISLPDSLKKYVKERAEEERYSTPSDYMKSLIREDMRHRDEQKLERMLLEGGCGQGGEWRLAQKNGRSFGKSLRLGCIPNNQKQGYEATALRADLGSSFSANPRT
jgi:Arc/MetJ-type ribon-helix-helix transcriptional regulator